MQDFTIQAIGPRDVPSLLTLMHDFYTIDAYLFDKNLAEKNFHQLLSNPDLGKGFLIISNGEVAGYLLLMNYFSFEFGGIIWFLDELYIKPEYQGKALGKQAVAFVKKLAQDNYIPVVLLEVENHNSRAIHLYEKLGFQMHKRSLMILKANY